MIEVIPLNYAVDVEVFRMVRGLFDYEVALLLCYEDGGAADGHAAGVAAEVAERRSELGAAYHGLPSVPQAPP